MWATSLVVSIYEYVNLVEDNRDIDAKLLIITKLLQVICND